MGTSHTIESAVRTGAAAVADTHGVLVIGGSAVEAKEAARMMFSVSVPVRVIGYTGDLGDTIEQVVEELAKLDACKSDLLDFAAHSDATDDTAVFTITVQAPSIEKATAAGVSCIRAAIHATGAATHGWDDTDAGDKVLIYQVDSDEGVEVHPLVDA